MKKYDYIIVGAGLYGATFAYIAKQKGKTCLVIDKRSHIGGNVYCEDINGITVHQYGPHIFHTNNTDVWNFVNKFVSFNHFTLNILAYYKGKLFSLPFNMNTFYQMWGATSPNEVQAIISRQSTCEKQIDSPHNLEEQAIQQVGKDVYDILIKGYTEKQWGRPCQELPTSIINRLPVRFTFDNRYFSDKYQGIPEKGYNHLLNGLLEGVECRLNCNYFEQKDFFDSIAKKIVYTGPIDQFFQYKFGHLEYRSLRFEQEIVPTKNYQGCAIMNYTDTDVPYTRIVEHKFFDINNQASLDLPYSVITYEYPMPFSMYGKQEPFYPINNKYNNDRYQKYRNLAEREKNLILGGRLAEYKYYNMDEVILQALKQTSFIE